MAQPFVDLPRSRSHRRGFVRIVDSDRHTLTHARSADHRCEMFVRNVDSDSLPYLLAEAVPVGKKTIKSL